MNLLEIRKWFVTASGRYDLIKRTGGSDNTASEAYWEDDGANKYILAGQVLLDDMQETPKSSAINLRRLKAETDTVTFGYVRVITEVWCTEPITSTRWKLTKETPPIPLLGEDVAYPDTNYGPPATYQIGTFRLAPETENTIDQLDIPIQLFQLVSSPLHNGIRVYPSADVDYIIETHGKFYTVPLLSNADENFWSSVYPHLLVMAAQCVLEMFARNSEGVKDWMNSIKLFLVELDKNIAEELSAEIDEMEG